MEDAIDYQALFPHDPDQEALYDQLDALLFDVPGNNTEQGLYAYLLIDAAASPEIETYLEGFGDNARCLFDGAVYEDLSEVAPWLVKLNRHGETFEWFVSEGWKNNWGTFLRSPLPLTKLKTRLKMHLYVQTPDSGRMFFKFYRPKTLRQYLPIFETPELARFFNGIDQVLVEDEDGIRIMSFAEQDGLKVNMVLSSGEKSKEIV